MQGLLDPLDGLLRLVGEGKRRDEHALECRHIVDDAGARSRGQEEKKREDDA